MPARFRVEITAGAEADIGAYRHFLYGNYRTVFRVAGSRVIILRVMHGARLLDSAGLEEPTK